MALWVLDLFTPQLFVAAILLNVPIALSSLALRQRLTISLIVSAEIANLVAGYVNGLQAGNHFDAIAIGDRALLALSFLLVGYMTIKTQDLARTAGLSDARAEVATRERRLRIALDHVRESLNLQLVLRAIVREGNALLGAQRGMLVVEPPALDTPKRYVGEARSRDVRTDRSPLSPQVRSLLARDIRAPASLKRNGEDTIARYALEALDAKVALIAPLRIDDSEFRLLLLSHDNIWDREDIRMLTSFAEQCEIAISQAQLFMRVTDQGQQIADQHEALVERSDVIRDLIYALAHDLRTPLAAANVTMQQAERGAYGELPKEYREILEATRRSNADLQRIVETLLLVARYESGEASSVREPVDLHNIAGQVRAELDASARERGVALAAEGSSAIVSGDAHELRRASINLVANALAATGEGGHVNIRTRSENGRAEFAVEDDGFGVAAEQRDALFQRFSSQTQRRGGGTGLGLYIVRLIAEKHGGSASYEPRERGSRFGYSLPADPKS